jgi:hypothetical protein
VPVPGLALNMPTGPFQPSLQGVIRLIVQSVHISPYLSPKFNGAFRTFLGGGIAKEKHQTLLADNAVIGYTGPA